MNLYFGGFFPKQNGHYYLNYLRNISSRYPGTSFQCVEFVIQATKMYLAAVRGSDKGIGVYDDARITVLYDGNLFNASELCVKESKSYMEFRDRVAEYIASRFLKQGTDILEQFDGNFSAVIYDKINHKLYLARDTKGYRMLYYTLRNDQFIFSSQLSSIIFLHHNSFELRSDLEPFHLVYGSSPCENTILNGIYKLNPGQILCFDINEGTTDSFYFTFRNQWSKSVPASDNNMSFKKAMNIMYEGFMDSLSDITRYHNHTAVLLGGVDSAAVAAGLKRLGKKVGTYTFCWPSDRFNQSNIDLLVKHLGFDHHWVKMDQTFITDHMEYMYDYIDEPRSEITYMICTTESCGLAHRHGYSIMVTGDESESTMGGYDACHNMASAINLMKHFPSILRRMIILFLSNPYIIEKMGHFARNILTVVKKSLYNDVRDRFISFRLFDDSELKQLLINFDNTHFNFYEEDIKKMGSPYEDLHPVFALHKGNEIFSASIRHKAAAAPRIYDIDFVSPFLHKGFVQMIKSLPNSVIYPNGIEKCKNAKWLFRETVKTYDLLPPKVSDQPKDTPGNTPIDFWMEGQFGQYILDVLLRELPANFSRPYINRLFKKKYFMELYRNYFGISAVTCHAQLALLGYTLFCRRINNITDASKNNKFSRPRCRASRNS